MAVMNRYLFSTKTANGRFETVRMPKPSVEPEDKYIITREGDRFDLLAQEFYQDVALWWFIAVANDIRPASMIVPVGIQLRIPANLDYLGRQLEKAEKDK
jgi:hypothetical protein